MVWKAEQTWISLAGLQDVFKVVGICIIWFRLSNALLLLIYLRGSLWLFGWDKVGRPTWSGWRQVGKGPFSLLWPGAFLLSSSSLSHPFTSCELKAGSPILPLLTQKIKACKHMQRGTRITPLPTPLMPLALLIWFWSGSSSILEFALKDHLSIKLFMYLNNNFLKCSCSLLFIPYTLLCIAPFLMSVSFRPGWPNIFTSMGYIFSLQKYLHFSL